MHEVCCRARDRALSFVAVVVVVVAAAAAVIARYSNRAL